LIETVVDYFFIQSHYPFQHLTAQTVYWSVLCELEL